MEEKDLNVTIKKSRDSDKRKTIWLPMEEDKLEEVCKELEQKYLQGQTPIQKVAGMKGFQIYWLIKM